MRTNPSISRVLSELKDQQTLNEAALNLLSERFKQKPLKNLSGIPPNIIYPSLYSSSNPLGNPLLLNNLNNNDLNEEDIRFED